MVFKFISTEKIRRLYYHVKSNAAHTGLSARLGRGRVESRQGKEQAQQARQWLPKCRPQAIVASTHKNYNYWAPLQTTESKLWAWACFGQPLPNVLRHGKDWEPLGCRNSAIRGLGNTSSIYSDVNANYTSWLWMKVLEWLCYIIQNQQSQLHSTINSSSKFNTQAGGPLGVQGKMDEARTF